MKKPPPLPLELPTAIPPPPSIDQQKLYDTIVTLQNVLTQVLDLSVTITPAQLHDVMEMFLSLMFMRKVLPDFWCDHASIATRGIFLAAQIAAEFRLAKMEGLSENNIKLLTDAVLLSNKEIKEIRVKLLEAVTTMRKGPLPGDTIH